MAAHEKEIAVIGLGTGLTTVRALNENPAFKVTGYDSRDRIGGHIHSINVRYLKSGQALIVKDKATSPPQASTGWMISL